MSGTEYTEPGQGATIGDLHDATCGPERWTESLNISVPALRHLVDLLQSNGKFHYARTNLRLTGSPLTAEDLKRIATCEVK